MVRLLDSNQKNPNRTDLIFAITNQHLPRPTTQLNLNYYSLELDVIVTVWNILASAGFFSATLIVIQGKELLCFHIYSYFKMHKTTAVFRNFDNLLTK